MGQIARRRIAVIGSGISGLSAAWLLAGVHDVVVYESDARLGGHSNTVDVPVPEGGTCAVDTGFIVYNPPSYPNLTALFAQLGVETAESSMSFAVSLDGGACEYSGSGLTGLFGQPANLLRPSHWRMAGEILRFFKLCTELAASGGDPLTSLGDWLSRNTFSADFVNRHIVPMGAAIWSTPGHEILDFPALSFARFFSNHGLLKLRRRPQWRTVVGGSRSYVRRLIADFGGRVLADAPVRAVVRGESGATVVTDGERAEYDDVVLACHADQALRLLGDADDLERRLLSRFRFTGNTAVLHTDPSLMPRRRRLWSSWNVLSDSQTPRAQPCVSYWMNRLQPLATRQNVFVTLNPPRELASGTVLARFAYEHPLFDGAAMSAQERLPQIQGRRSTWFAGAWCGFGFHEDGLQSGLWVATQLGARAPWSVGQRSFERIFGGLTASIGPPPDSRSALVVAS